MKKPYIPPTITIETVQIEHSIAAGSATIVISNSINEIDHQWDNNITDDREVYW